jgi:3-dehydroquinate dehydratase-2
MSFTVLVLHGPNLKWLGQDEIDERLEARAEALGVDLQIAQSNGEGALIDELHEREGSYQAVIVNPGALAPSAWALAEALQLVKVPAVEVLLEKLPEARGTSALTGVVKRQFHGHGPDGYLLALDAVVGPGGPGRGLTPSPEEGEEAAANEEDEDGGGPVRSVSRAGKSIGKKASAPAPAVDRRGNENIGRREKPNVASPAPRVAKSIGRGAKASERVARSADGLTRMKVREQIAERLARRLSPEALASWARAEWAALQSGGPCEEGARELLDGVLLALMAGAKASEDVLLAQMAKL